MREQWDKFKESKWIVPIFFAMILALGGLIAYLILYKLHLGLALMAIVVVWLVVKLILFFAKAIFDELK